MTAAIPATATDSLNVFVQRADNQIMIVFNGSVVYDKKPEYPEVLSELNEDINLSGRFIPGRNHLLVIGADWGAVYHYKGKILHSGQDIFEFDDQGPSGYGAKVITSLIFECPPAN